MAQKYNGAITTTAGFKYSAQAPIDDRTVVETYDDLTTLYQENKTYKGMRVYVLDENASYEQYTARNTWKKIAYAEDIPTIPENVSVFKNDAKYISNASTTSGILIEDGNSSIHLNSNLDSKSVIVKSPDVITLSVANDTSQYHFEQAEAWLFNNKNEIKTFAFKEDTIYANDSDIDLLFNE